MAVALNNPAIITPRAAAGLFTAVTRAGSRLVAVGERGRILLSDDNGASWRQVATPTRVTLTAVRFATPSSGWALGQMGLVLHSADGGLDWTKQLDGLAANALMLQTATAAAAGHGSDAAAAANLLAAQELASGGPDVPFLAIFPLSSQHLLLMGAYGLELASDDAGQHWQSIAAACANPNALHVYAIARAGPTVFLAGEQGLLLRGPAGGPYTPLTPPFQGTFFGALVTPQASLLLFGLQGTVLRSTDAGATFSRPASHTEMGIDAGIILQNGDILLGDVAGDLLLSHDDGKTFTLRQQEEPIAGLAQAADGAIIIAGPFGLRRLNPGTA